MLSIKFLIYTCVVCLFFSFSAANSDAIGQHQFHVSLDEDSKFLLHWSVDNTAQTTTFTLEVKTTGWIGFGISPYTGKMPGSDVVIGWVDNNGAAYLQDRFAKSRSLPLLDDQQDYKLISGKEVDGKTILTFSRKWDTKDKNDLPLERGTTRLIWSYHQDDPPSPTKIPMHQKMGARSLNLFERMPDAHKPELPSDTQYFDFAVSNITIPTTKTTYWCAALKLPQVSGKHHIVKIDPRVTKGNEGVVHHMVLYECPVDNKYHGYSSDCNVQNMPIHLRRCRSGSVVVGWAVGGEPITFPSHAGLALGSESSPKFAIIEMHYDNPEHKTGIIDNSGFRLYYTKQLREHDVGVLTTGKVIFWSMMIPEKQTKWDITGYCPKYCTERGIAKEGINVFGAFLHTHLAGIALKTRHFRNGTELPVLVENKHYDFNYQEVVYMKDEVKIFPGDSLTLTCTYQTKDRDKLTLAGLETTDEMCLSYIFYYPKMKFAECLSYTNFETIAPYLFGLIEKGIMPTPVTNNTADFVAAMKKTTIGDQKLINELSNLLTYSHQNMYCSNRDHSLAMETFPMKIPNFKPLANYTAPVPSPTPNNANSIGSVGFIATLFFASVATMFT